MRALLATLCLNEIEWLPYLYQQHQDWPDVVGWCFVEAADRAYIKANPGKTTPEVPRRSHWDLPGGLSTDGTTEYLDELHLLAPYLPTYHIRAGVVGDGGPQGKCEARNRYLELADQLKVDWIIVLDADEFYTVEDQHRISFLLRAYVKEPRPPLLFRQRQIWSPPSLGELLPPARFRFEVTGGYWSVPHLRVWPHYQGMRYRTNHNWPELPDGTSLRDRMIRYDRDVDAPECVHMAFASKGDTRKAKHAYYRTRGEGPDDGRQLYVECRAAWESWQTDAVLPARAKVIEYQGPIPECFR